MSWTERTETTAVEEWVREDGWATIRLRRRGAEAWLVRLDRLTQAPEGSLYREQHLDTRAAAEGIVAEWQGTYDVSAADDTDADGTDTDADGTDADADDTNADDIDADADSDAPDA